MKRIGKIMLGFMANHPIYFAIFGSLLICSLTLYPLITLTNNFVALIMTPTVFSFIWFLAFISKIRQYRIYNRLEMTGKLEVGYTEEIKNDPLFSFFGNPALKVIQDKEVPNIRLIWLD